MIYGKTGRLYDLKVKEGRFTSLDNSKFESNAIYYFHAYYDLHHGIKMLNCLTDDHWKHLRDDNTTKFLYENCNETFTHTLAKDIYDIINLKGIDPKQIYLIVMDEVHRNFILDRLKEYDITTVTVGVYNNLLSKTQIPFELPLTTNKFSSLSRNYRAWRLRIYAELVKRGIIKNFNYSFYNIFPYGEVKYYSVETMKKDLTDTNFGNIDHTVELWLNSVPYTLDDPNDNVLNKWNDSTYSCVLSADFHLLIETHYDLFYYVPTTDRVYNRKLAPSSITEKTNKPIACSRPFIVFSTPYFLEDLKQLGYKTFSPYVNEDYDKEPDNLKRLNMIVAEIERICSLPQEQYSELLDKCRSIANYNLQVLKQRKFKTEFDTRFEFLRDYLEPSANIQIF